MRFILGNKKTLLGIENCIQVYFMLKLYAFNNILAGFLIVFEVRTPVLVQTY